MALLAALSVALSPGLHGLARVWAVSLFAGWLACVWLVQGLFLIDYYELSGALATIALAMFTIPAWRGATLSRGKAVIAGFALALLCASAYAYIPSAGLFAVSGCMVAWQDKQRAAIGWLAIGSLAGILLLSMYFIFFVDLYGYISYHIIETQLYYSYYIFPISMFFRSLLFSFRPDHMVQTFSLLCVLFSFFIFIITSLRQDRGSRSHITAIIFCFVGVMLLNARGEARFQNGPFVVSAIAIAALALGYSLSRLPVRYRMTGSIIVLMLVTGAETAGHYATFSPYGLLREPMLALPHYSIPTRSEAPIFNRVRSLVGPTERVLALPYWPNFYLESDRFPIDGIYAYFPWNADYALAPWLGRPRDLCDMLRKSPPPLIAYSDAYMVWGYDPHKYMPCLFEILDDNYIKDKKFSDLYIRRDRAINILAGHER